jgi:hypothetical protein
MVKVLRGTPVPVGGGSGLPNLAKYLNVHSTLNMDTNNIINVKDPINDQDAVSKYYVDNSFINVMVVIDN